MWGAILGSAVSALIGRSRSKGTSVSPGINNPPGNQHLPGVSSKPEEPSLSDMIRMAAKTSISGAIGNRIGSALTRSPRHAGNAAGRTQKAYMDTVYPGTTPWDRLSGNASSAGSVGNMSAQLRTQKEIAHINANAKIKSAEIAARGIPAAATHRLEQASTEREQRGKLRAETSNIKLESDRRRIELNYVERLQKANLSYAQSRNILQQWRQATNGYMTDENVSLVSAAASTIGASAVAAYLAKSLATKSPVAKIIQGLMKLIPKNMLSTFKSYLQRGIRVIKGK